MWGDWTHLSSADRAAWMTAGATWATVVVGLLALGAAAYAAIQASRVYRIESEREKRSQEERRRAQADLVSGWHDPVALGGVFYARVRNASTAPVFDVEVNWYHTNGDHRGGETVAVVPPASEPMSVRHPTTDPRYIGPNEDHRSEETPDAFAVDLRFRDASGNVWHRDVHGVLTDT
jgi:hypothetical protein